MSLEATQPGVRIRQAAAEFWLRLLFWFANHAPSAAKFVKPFFLWFAWNCSRSIRANTKANAAHLLGVASTPRERAALGKRVLSSFYDAVLELGSNGRASREQVLAKLDYADGHDDYIAMRKRNPCGAILVTAHLGSFETGMTLLTRYEHRLHVVFKRDPFPLFERLRAAQRARMGIVEAPVDDGLPVWFALRSALASNEVVLMQGDRVLPGQRGVPTPVLGSRMLLPVGPVKLAMATGAPLVPVFAVTAPDGRVRVYIENPIWVRDQGSAAIAATLKQFADTMARHITRYPEQWLCLHRAWIEDASPPHHDTSQSAREHVSSPA